MARKSIDPFSAHEAMDRTHLLASTFVDFVVEHSFIQTNPKLRREVMAIADALGDLYQSVGHRSVGVADLQYWPGEKMRFLR